MLTIFISGNLGEIPLTYVYWPKEPPLTRYPAI